MSDGEMVESNCKPKRKYIFSAYYSLMSACNCIPRRLFSYREQDRYAICVAACICVCITWEYSLLINGYRKDKLSATTDLLLVLRLLLNCRKIYWEFNLKCLPLVNRNTEINVNNL